MYRIIHEVLCHKGSVNFPGLEFQGCASLCWAVHWWLCWLVSLPLLCCPALTEYPFVKTWCMHILSFGRLLMTPHLLTAQPALSYGDGKPSVGDVRDVFWKDSFLVTLQLRDFVARWQFRGDWSLPEEKEWTRGYRERGKCPQGQIPVATPIFCLCVVYFLKLYWIIHWIYWI